MKSVISISRRTDVVAFHSQQLRKALEAGQIMTRPPRSTTRIVSLQPEDVHTLVFWSKNYTPLLADVKLKQLLAQYESLYFHFTITGLGGTTVEPRVPRHTQAIQQVRDLVDNWGAERINWRFDPIVHWRDGTGTTHSNVPLFAEIARPLAELGIKRCTFSFAQWYGKIPSRSQKLGFAYVDPHQDVRRDELLEIIHAADRFGIGLYSCAQDAWLELPGINKGHCIDATLLSALHPRKIPAPAGKDRGQREQCGCSPSVDIGSYDTACPHGCVYCYANPSLFVKSGGLQAWTESSPTALEFMPGEQQGVTEAR